jgi:hypothetical protein
MNALRLIGTLALGLVVPICSVAQQQPPPPPKKVPTLTTEDVMRRGGDVETSDVVEESSGKKKSDAGAKASGERGEKTEISSEEKAWRENVKQARQRADAAQRAAEEAELRVTDLRNRLSVSGLDQRDRNVILAEMEETGDTVKQLRAEAKQAKSDLENALDQGREKGYREDAGPSETTKDGKPNESYYREKYAKLTKELDDAQRRVQLYDDRVRDINQRITINSRTGDNYFIAKLQQDRDEAQQSLQDAQASVEKAQQDIDALKEEARTSGVPPGVFR